MRSGGDNPDSVQSHTGGNLPGEFANWSAGRNNGGKNFGWKAKTLKQMMRPGSFDGVKELCCRGIGEFTDLGSRKTPMEVIRHHQKTTGSRKELRSVSFKREQLIKRIQFHELDAGMRKNFVAGHLLESLRHLTAGAGIPVVMWQSKEFASF